MSVVITFLILAPVAAITLVAIAIDERYGLTDRVAHTRLGVTVRTFIARHIDKAT